MKREGKMGRSGKTDQDRRTNILLEAIRGDIRVVAEGHAMLARRLDEHDAKLEMILNKLQGHDNRFIEIGQRFDRLEMIVTEINDRMKSDSTRIDSHETRLTRLEDKIYH
jgi:chromosome segregation ATPase